jgi:hypothetical protein
MVISSEGNEAGSDLFIILLHTSINNTYITTPVANAPDGFHMLATKVCIRILFNTVYIGLTSKTSLAMPLPG